MIRDTIRPTNGPAVTRHLQALKVNRVQAMRVRLAIRWGIAPDDVGLWRAELELKRQQARMRALQNEEVLAWQ